ncbi:MAG: hypothetical protein QMB94_07635 [Phycisphaerales bacterium]
MNTTARRMTLATTAILISSLTGCVIGNTTNLKRPTTGRELIDLQTAYAEGSIDQMEYDQTRASILAKANSSTGTTVEPTVKTPAEKSMPE